MADATIFETELGDPVTCLAVHMPYVIVGMASGAVWALHLAPAAGGQPEPHGDVTEAVAATGRATAAIDGETAVPGGAVAAQDGSAVAAAAASTARDSDSTVPIGTGGAAAAVAAAAAHVPAGSAESKPEDAAPPLEVAAETPSATVSGDERGSGGAGGGLAPQHVAVGVAEEVKWPLQLAEVAAHEIKPFSDEAVKAAFVEQNILYFTVGDVGGEVWDLRDGTRVRAAKFRRHGRHTYSNCPATSSFQIGTVATVIQAEGTRHYTHDLKSGRGTLLSVDLPRDEMPVYFDGQYLVTKSHGSEDLKSVRVWLWGEKHHRELLGSAVVNDKYGASWGFVARANRLWSIGRNRLQLYSVHDGEEAADPVVHDDAIAAVEVLGQDGSIVVTITESGVVQVVDDERHTNQAAAQLPKTRSWATQVPYFARVVRSKHLAHEGMAMLIYNDDSGVHVRLDYLGID